MAVDRVTLSRQGALEESPQEGIKGVHSTGSRSVQGMDCIERKSRIRSGLCDADRGLSESRANSELSA